MHIVLFMILPKLDMTSNSHNSKSTTTLNHNGQNVHVEFTLINYQLLISLKLLIIVIIIKRIDNNNNINSHNNN